MVKKRGLGKSLDALLAYTHTENVMEEVQTTREKFCQLPLTQIERGKYQPRREIDSHSLEELANSIRAQGVIQPIVVRPQGDHYEIIAGERRWRAAQQAGLTEIPALIRDITDETAMAVGLIENIQREDLNPIEEAFALHRLIEEFGMTHQEVADAVGKSRVTVTNLLRLLSLPNDIKNMLQKGLLEMGHARALLSLPEVQQIQIAEIIIKKGLSVRETENKVRQIASADPKKSAHPQDPHIQRLQESLSQRLNLPVALYCNAKGKGRLVIHYKNLTELDEFLAQLETI